MESQTNDRLRSGSENAAVKSVVDRARIEGPNVYLEVLNDRLIWNETSVMVQDLAIQEVARRLSPEFNFVETNIYCCGGQTHRIATFQHRVNYYILNLVPGGKFRIGNPTPTDNSQYIETPVREVSITPFLVGKFPLSNQQWALLPNSENIDEVYVKLNISWSDCQSWLEAQGGRLRFISESEWEYACRSGTQSSWFFGDDEESLQKYISASSKINFNDSNLNSFGLALLYGTCWEWCCDDFVQTYDHGPNSQKPRLVGSDSPLQLKIVRGMEHSSGMLTSATRRAFPRVTRRANFGVRLALSI